MQFAAANCKSEKAGDFTAGVEIAVVENAACSAAKFKRNKLLKDTKWRKTSSPFLGSTASYRRVESHTDVMQQSKPLKRTSIRQVGLCNAWCHVAISATGTTAT